MAKKYWKSRGKVREFCQSRKVGTLHEKAKNLLRSGWTVFERQSLKPSQTVHGCWVSSHGYKRSFLLEQALKTSH